MSSLPRRTLFGSLPGLMVPGWALAQTSRPPPHRAGLRTEFARFTGDLDGLLKRRLLRILVPYSPTLFFRDKGRLYGTVADGATTLETWINRNYKLQGRPVTVVLLPTSRDRLFDDLLAGVGDIAAGDITITDERRRRVAFTAPLLKDVHEIVITEDDVPDLPNVEALSGKSVAVRRSTTDFESLRALNQRLIAAGAAPAKLITVPDTLESEDMMEMTGAGLLPAMVADDWIAEIWAQLLRGLKLHPKAILRSGAEIAWAVRPDNPELLAALNRIIAEQGGVSAMTNRTRSYLAQLKQLHSATRGADHARFEATLAIFRKYAGRYGFDTLLLLAQSYQESRLDQAARSHVGAIGLMQLMPETGGSLGVGDIRQAEPNVHAGAKYMARIMDHYFKDAHFDEQNRSLFAFAAYNAGPNRILRLRQTAAQQKLDPNVWFDNVERVAAAQVGQEPVRYVRNIYKYYVAYKLLEDAEATNQAASRQ